MGGSKCPLEISLLLPRRSIHISEDIPPMKELEQHRFNHERCPEVYNSLSAKAGLLTYFVIGRGCTVVCCLNDQAYIA